MMDLEKALAIREKIAPLTVFERLDLAGIMMSDETFTKSGFVSKTKKGEETNGKPKGYHILPISDILSVVHKVHGLCGVKVLLGPPHFDNPEPKFLGSGDNTERFMGKTYTGQKTLATPYGTTNSIVTLVDFRIFGKDEDDCITGKIAAESRASDDKTTNLLVTNAERTLYRVMYAIDGAEDPETVNDDAKVIFDEPKPVANPNDKMFGRKKIEEVSAKVEDSDLKHLLDLIESIDENTPQGKAAGQVAERISKELRKPMTSWDIDHLRQVCIAGGVKE